MNKIEILSERECQVLSATIKDYIHTAQPVASNRVRELYRLQVSPATIRNTMALLERGYILLIPIPPPAKYQPTKGIEHMSMNLW